ncbi:MAG: nicotinate-nucleotide adenylyltransferase [Granulosicoccus sp.]
MSPARIGLFGGTFDPVHYGHLRPAIELAEHYALDVLYLLPSHQPVHRGPTGASSSQRIDMLQMAVADVERLEVDTREALRGGSTYTIDTLEAMREEFPNATLLFFLGMDSFAGFDGWRRWQDILSIANLVVIDRPGALMSDFSTDLMEQQKKRFGVERIERIDVTQLEISATAIRQAAAAGHSLRFLLPEPVRQYIEEHQLYRRMPS